MTKEEIKPIGDYIFENIPPEKRFQTNDGMYIHYSDACTLLNKHSADLTAENTRLREALALSKETIKLWACMGVSKSKEEETWGLYQNSPEMKVINEALK